jgi:hypothetical protein
MNELGSRVSDAAKKDPLIAGSSISAFIQHVLVLELTVRLIGEDMGVDERAAIEIMEESQEIGEKLNPVTESGDLYGAEDADKWVDINAASAWQRRQSGIELKDDEEW